MATTWGAWRYGGGNGMRVGIDVSVSSVSTSSSNVKFTVRYYVQNQYRYNDFQWIDKSGNITGRTDYNNQGDHGAVLHVATNTHTYNYSNWGSSPGSRTFGATVGGAYNNVTPSHSRSVSIPARPYASPNAPSNVSASRISDSQAKVTWTRNTTSQRPYTGQTVQMRTYNNGAWGSWSTVSNASGTATSYTRSGLSADRAYQFRVRSNNSVGSSSYRESGNVYMSPAAPSNVSAGRGSGNTVDLTWKNNHEPWTGNTLRIQRSTDGGSNWSTVASGLSRTTTSWSDTNPNPADNIYRVRAEHSTGVNSSYATSNTVTVAVPPLAPTLLSPDGEVVNFTEDVTVTWQHNPGADGAAQTLYQVLASTDGGSTWVYDSGQVSSSASSHTFPADTFVNGDDVLWKVLVRGSADAAWGPESTTASLIGRSDPVATFEPDFPPATAVILPVTVEWAYNQDQGTPQAAWVLEVIDTATGNTVDYQTGKTQTSTVIDATLLQGSTYEFQLYVQSGDGLWSPMAVATTLIDLLPPADVEITPTYDSCKAAVFLEIVPNVAVPDVTVPVAQVDVQRRLSSEGEDAWTTIAVGLEVPVAITDPIPATVGTTEYRAVAYAHEQSQSIGPEAPVEASIDYSGYVSWGPAFSRSLHVRSKMGMTATAGRAGRAQHFLGRAKPVGLWGKSTSMTIEVEAVVQWRSNCPPDEECQYDTGPLEWIEAAQASDVVCVRDYEGRRLFAQMGPVSVASSEIATVSTVTFTLTEIDYDEQPSYLPEESVEP